MKRLIDSFSPGTRVFVSAMSSESALLAQELAADPERARDVHFTANQFPGIDRTDYLAAHPTARLATGFMSPSARSGLEGGRTELLSLDYLGLADRWQNGPRFDVALTQLCPPDADGWCAGGVNADFAPLVWARARQRIAHLNPRLPRLPGSFRVHISEIDVAVEADLPLLDYAERPAGEVERRIGAHVANLVRDGDCLQFGIGGVPLALAGALIHHRQLRLHAGMVTSALSTLWDAGALDRDARITTGMVLGDAALRDVAANLPQIWLTDVTQTHGLAALAVVPRLVAVNAAVEVDLFGQVNSERAQGRLQAGSGGLPAFAQGSRLSPGGRLLICLGSTARKGTVSSIVPSLGAHGLCTLGRHLADTVVTEHGVAELRGLGLEARAQALIAIADPAHRDALAAAWDGMRRGL